METKFYILYKTTNLKNNKFYIGVHETFNLEDGYLGSGKKFKNSLYYHGKENFKREILEYFNDSKSMYNREVEFVNEELLKNPKCLNLKIGGSGGFKYNHTHQLYASKMLHLKLKTDLVFRKQHLQKLSHSIQKAMDAGKMKTWKDTYDWTGKYHSDETKKKIGESVFIKQMGCNNSQYGTCWITNEIENKKIYKGDEIPNGFRLGRT